MLFSHSKSVTSLKANLVKKQAVSQWEVYGVGAKGVLYWLGGSTVAVCTLERLRTIDVKLTRLDGSAVPI